MSGEDCTDKFEQAGEESSDPVDFDTSLEQATWELDRYCSDFDHVDIKAIGLMATLGLLASFQVLNIESLVALLRTVTEVDPGLASSLSIVAVVAFVLFLFMSLRQSLLAIRPRTIDYPSNPFDNEGALLADYIDCADKLREIVTSKADNVHASVLWLICAVVAILVHIISTAVANALATPPTG